MFVFRYAIAQPPLSIHSGSNREEVRLFHYFFFRFLTLKEICYTHHSEFSITGIQGKN